MVRREEIAELEAMVTQLKDRLEQVRQEAGLDAYAYAAPPEIDSVEFLGRLYQERRLREDVFGDPDLFGEPAWDMLLDLAVSEGKGKPVSVSALCIGSCVPPTTALRWIKILEERELIVRRDDPLDYRRSFLSLSDSGRARLRRFVAKSALLRGAVRGG